MLIGVPKEIKNHEYRAGMIPGSVREVIAHGHTVVVETDAGSGIGFTDEDYAAAGATILDTAEEVYAKADMIVKVKEPLTNERKLLRKGQILFTFLHLAPDMPQTEELVASGATCIAYETVTSPYGGLPLLAPMSEVAGRMSIQAGAQCLEKSRGGLGMLLGGVPGVSPAKCVVIGGGVVGRNAIRMAVGLGARVVVIDRNVDVLRRLTSEFGSQIETVYSNQESLEQEVTTADLVIGGVLIPGAAAPKLVTEDMIKKMKPGAVLVDVAIDQGGCFATSKATTHDNPTFVKHDVVHYCVANMPGAVPRTSTFALNNTTLPYIINIANKGYKEAMAQDPHLRNGLNVYKGQVTEHSVAEHLGFEYVSPKDALGLSDDTL